MQITNLESGRRRKQSGIRNLRIKFNLELGIWNLESEEAESRER
jgi:hypothetical protein